MDKHSSVIEIIKDEASMGGDTVGTEAQKSKLFPSWRMLRLEEVCLEEPQNGAFIKNPNYGQGTLFVNVYDIYQNIILDLKVVDRLLCEPAVVKRYSLNENDLLFVRSSLKREGIGQCCLVRSIEEPTIFDCHLIRIVPNGNLVDPLFLAYFFLSEQGKSDLIARSKTTTMTTINQNTLIDALIPLPSLSEQREIAQTLRTIQVAIEARRHELELERERKAALIEYLFAYGTRKEPLKQTKMGDLPESWGVASLEDICLNIVDCPHSTPHFCDSGVLVVRNFNIREGILVLNPAFYTTEEEYTQRVKRCEPKEGDILFSREAPVGEACLIPSNTRLSLGQRMMLLRPNSSKVNNYFLVQTFYSLGVRARMLALASGVTAKHLNVADVRRLEIPLPPLTEQNQIANVLSASDTKIIKLQREIILIEELFTALLEEIMSGRLSTMSLIEKGGTHE